MNFDNFVGNSHLKNQLSRFIETRKIHNSYVFSGENGIGKKTLSSLFIKNIFCEASHESGACGICTSCKQVSSKNHPDLIYLTKLKDKKTIGIDEVREQIIKQVYIKPFSAQKKIFVINDGDDLTVEAQNGLLKVLEEPPEYVTFIILVTKTSKLLDTVLSRSCVFNLHPAKKDEVMDFLTKEYDEYTAENLEFAVNFSQGIIGKAIKILTDEDYKALFYETAEQMKNVMNDKKSLITFHRFLAENKDYVELIIEFILIYLRDCLLMYEGLTQMLVCPKSIINIDQSIQKKNYVHCMDSVLKFKNALYTNVNYTILTLDFLSEIQSNCNIN